MTAPTMNARIISVTDTSFRLVLLADLDPLCGDVEVRAAIRGDRLLFDIVSEGVYFETRAAEDYVLRLNVAIALEDRLVGRIPTESELEAILLEIAPQIYFESE